MTRLHYIPALCFLLGLSSALLPSGALAQNAIALSEMQSIAQGLDTCNIDTTYYVSPETLDDTTNSSSTATYNYINDQGGTYVVPPDWGYFKPARVDLIAAFLHWNGPYLTYQAGRIQTGNTPYDKGSPLDPWGTPYLLFSPLGLLRGDTGQVTLDYYADNFDRYTLVSLGADTVQSGDDLIYQFGAGITSFALSSLRAGPSGAHASSLSAAPGSGIVVRGMNLGATQTGAQVMWGSQQLTNITSWNSREIGITLPTTTGTAQLTVQRSSSVTNALTLTIAPIPTAANDWQLFQ